MGNQSFYRLKVVRVPFTDKSATVEFALFDKLPDNPATGHVRDDLTFMFVNTSGYDLRLEGTPQNMTGTPAVPFVPVAADTGWSIMARTVMGPFTSKKPRSLSVQAFSTPGNPIPPDADFTGCFLELVYGTGR